MVVALCILFFFSNALCMEKQNVQNRPKFEMIELCDGRLVVSGKLLEKFQVIQDQMNVAGEVIELKTDSYYTIENFTKLFECVRNNMNINKLCDQRIKYIIDLAGNLGV